MWCLGLVVRRNTAPQRLHEIDGAAGHGPTLFRLRRHVGLLGLEVRHQGLLIAVPETRGNSWRLHDGRDGGAIRPAQQRQHRRLLGPVARLGMNGGICPLDLQSALRARSRQLSQATQRVELYFGATPEKPDWIERVPLIGRRLSAGWDRIVREEGDLRTLLEPYTADLEHWLIGAAAAAADSLVQVVLSLIATTMFWTNGDGVLAILHDALRRLGGPVAEQALDVAAGAIRGVVYGVIGTAVILGLARTVRTVRTMAAWRVLEPEGRGPYGSRLRSPLTDCYSA